MKEPRWLKIEWLKAIHASQIQQFGGSFGVRDEGLIESALMRPQHRWTYEQDSVDLADLAASYGHGLVKNHGFVDGNKRISFQAMYVFLGMNGYRIDAPEPEVVRVIIDLASSKIGENEMAEWLRSHINKR